MRKGKTTVKANDSGEVSVSYYGVDLHKDQITWLAIYRTTDGSMVPAGPH